MPGSYHQAYKPRIVTVLRVLASRPGASIKELRPVFTRAQSLFLHFQSAQPRQLLYAASAPSLLIISRSLMTSSSSPAICVKSRSHILVLESTSCTRAAASESLRS